MGGGSGEEAYICNERHELWGDGELICGLYPLTPVSSCSMCKDQRRGLDGSVLGNALPRPRHISCPPLSLTGGVAVAPCARKLHAGMARRLGAPVRTAAVVVDHLLLTPASPNGTVGGLTSPGFIQSEPHITILTAGICVSITAGICGGRGGRGGRGRSHDNWWS